MASDWNTYDMVAANTPAIPVTQPMVPVPGMLTDNEATTCADSNMVCQVGTRPESTYGYGSYVPPAAETCWDVAANKAVPCPAASAPAAAPSGSMPTGAIVAILAAGALILVLWGGGNLAGLRGLLGLAAPKRRKHRRTRR